MAALRQYGRRRWRRTEANKLWDEAIEESLQYYEKHDPVRADLMRLRYFGNCTEQQVLDQLHIGRTTYQKAQQDMLSTVAICAAQRGVLPTGLQRR